MTDAPAKHPGRILYEQVMVPLGVSRNKLARDIDVPVGRISDIVAGKRGITPDTALRFAKYFGTTAELWLRLQSDYDLQVARETTWRDAEAKVAVFEPLSSVDEGAASPAMPALEAVPPAVPSTRPAPAPETPPFVQAPVAETPASSPAPVAGVQDEPDLDEDDEDIDIPEPIPGPPGGRPA
jgi:addiction module HigA family antidote